MDKIFMNSTDTNVAARKVYTKAADTFAYSDHECKNKISATDLKDAFIKGVVIIDTANDDAIYLPISCKIASKVATLTYVTADSVATTAKLATVKSE